MPSRRDSTCMCAIVQLMRLKLRNQPSRVPTILCVFISKHCISMAVILFIALFSPGEKGCSYKTWTKFSARLGYGLLGPCVWLLQDLWWSAVSEARLECLGLYSGSKRPFSGAALNHSQRARMDGKWFGLTCCVGWVSCLLCGCASCSSQRFRFKLR